MNVDQLEGSWEQVKGQVKEKWGKLTHDDLMAVHGKKDQLLGKIRERYGYSAEQANRELTSFMKECRDCGPNASEQAPAAKGSDSGADAKNASNVMPNGNVNPHQDVKGSIEPKPIPGEKITSPV